MCGGEAAARAAQGATGRFRSSYSSMMRSRSPRALLASRAAIRLASHSCAASLMASASILVEAVPGFATWQHWSIQAQLRLYRPSTCAVRSGRGVELSVHQVAEPEE